mmetsp:Transcript_57687/g.135152  ORF Transcript_57687/g.135152 Transcript_57687/m.135152 type:complete len:81 (+) Transcript_57687:443-685(+)
MAPVAVSHVLGSGKSRDAEMERNVNIAIYVTKMKSRQEGRLNQSSGSNRSRRRSCLLQKSSLCLPKSCKGSCFREPELKN